MNHKTDVRPRCSKALSGPANLKKNFCSSSLAIAYAWDALKSAIHLQDIPFLVLIQVWQSYLLLYVFFSCSVKKMVFNAKTVIGILSLLVTFMFCWSPPLSSNVHLVWRTIIEFDFIPFIIVVHYPLISAGNVINQIFTFRNIFYYSWIFYTITRDGVSRRWS